MSGSEEEITFGSPARNTRAKKTSGKEPHVSGNMADIESTCKEGDRNPGPFEDDTQQISGVFDTGLEQFRDNDSNFVANVLYNPTKQDANVASNSKNNQRKSVGEIVQHIEQLSPQITPLKSVRLSQLYKTPTYLS